MMFTMIRGTLNTPIALLIVGILSVGSWLYINNKSIQLELEKEQTRQAEINKSSGEGIQLNGENSIKFNSNEIKLDACVDDVNNTFASADTEGASIEEYRLILETRENELNRCYERYPIN